LITSNSQDVAKSLDEAAKVIERRLKQMMAGFAAEVASKASANTPIGNAEDAQNETTKYGMLYKNREKNYKIDADVGFHKGAFVYSESMLGTEDFNPNIVPVGLMLADIENMAESQYQIGDDFYIGAVGPGYAALESGSSDQAPDGISKPTISDIQNANASDLQRLYREQK